MRSLLLDLRYFTVVLVAMATLALLPVVNAYAGSNYVLEVFKSKRLMVVKNGNEIEKTYQISAGRGGRGHKQKVGDNKTPEGQYRVMGFNENSRFHVFIRLNYPNVKDAFFGLKNDIISRAEFDRIVKAIQENRLPPQNTALGGAIGLHGVGFETPKKLHIQHNLDWTEGCLALTNNDIDDLRNFVTIGTKVIIFE